MKFLEYLAYLTRIFHPRGTSRLLRLCHNPNKQEKAIHTILTYDKDVKIQIDTSSYLEWNLFFLGYESNIRNIINDRLKNGGVFIDVGANVGIHTLVASKKAKEVIAIEPIPETAKRLAENCIINNIKNVKILQCSVSNRNGQATIYKGGFGQNGASSFYPDENTTEGIKCEVLTLDSMIKEKKVDFIKIDAEGEDGRVLLGAKAIINRDLPIIIFEYSKKWEKSGVSFSEIKDLLYMYDMRILNNDKFCHEVFCLPK